MKYDYLLQHHRLKATPQRIAIMELMHHAGHITIDDLYRAIRQKFASISLATLYKNIHTMMDVHLIREVKVTGLKSKYEIEKKAHAHIVCNACGELKDMPFDPIRVMQDTTQLSNYVINDVSIVISGICPSCQKEG
jgi:Fur family transcriptional regulator, peroxide stress response regulator